MNSFIDVEIRELGETITGKTPSSNNPEDFGSDYMFVTPSDELDKKVLDKTERYISKIGYEKLKGKILPPKSVMVSCIGSAMGKVTMNKTTCLTNQQINSIVIGNEYDADYIYYALKNNYKLLRNAATGSTALPLLNKTDFDLIQFRIHRNKTTQQNISSVLSALDAKIELNNKINAKLEAMAKTLYDYWFVQFDFPMTKEQADAIGKPAAAGKPYKSYGGKMVYNQELKREIPEGWEVKEINECVDTIIDHRGKTPTKLGGSWSNEDNAIIALSAKIVKGGKLINLNQANRVSQGLYDKWMPLKLQDGDILMTSEAPAGEFYFIHDFTEYCLSQRLFALRANSNIIIPSYFYYELSKGHGYSQIQGSLSGSTVFGIRQDVLRTVKVVIPKMELQEKFNEIVLPQLRQIKQFERQNQQLTELRDWLLPMLMNGQVTVRQAHGKPDNLDMAAEPKGEYNGI